MTETVTVCKNHPERETSLRCNRCNEPICSECAVQTPTGYRCPQCVAGQQKVFDTAKPQDYVLAFLVSVVLSFIGMILARLVGGFGFFGIFLLIMILPVIGSVIGEAVRRVTGRRRAKSLFQTVIAAIFIGAIPSLLPSILQLFVAGNFGSLTGLIIPVIYVILVSSSAWYNLTGIQLKR